MLLLREEFFSKVLNFLLQPGYKLNAIAIPSQSRPHFLHFDLITRDYNFLPLQFLLHPFNLGHVDGTNIPDLLAQQILVVQLRALGDLLAL